jgi:hypothetical protein
LNFLQNQTGAAYLGLVKYSRTTDLWLGVLVLFDQDFIEGRNVLKVGLDEDLVTVSAL